MFKLRRKSASTFTASCISYYDANSLGLWLIPFKHLTNSIAIGQKSDIAELSWVTPDRKISRRSQNSLNRLTWSIHQLFIAALKFHEKLAKFSKNALLSFIIKFMIKVLSETTINKKLYNPINIPLWEKGRDYQHKLMYTIDGHSPDISRGIILITCALLNNVWINRKLFLKTTF